MGDWTEEDDLRGELTSREEYQCAGAIVSCVKQSFADAKHFAESGLAEAVGVKEEDTREKLLKINLAKQVHPKWGDTLRDDKGFVRKVLGELVRNGDIDGDAARRVFAFNWIIDHLL